MAKELYGLKVLVVDDDKDTLELLEWVLQRAGADVVAVASAPQAMEALERERPHILVSDIAMPEEDGLSLMRRIRALPKERGGRIPAGGPAPAREGAGGPGRPRGGRPGAPPPRGGRREGGGGGAPAVPPRGPAP